MRYGRQHESDARTAYEEHLKSRHSDAKANITGVHIDTTHCWLAASPDGLVFDPLAINPEGVLEIKCPFTAKDTPLLNLCTNPKKKSQFFMKYDQQTRKFSLKRQHPYYYQVQGQMQIARRKWCDFYVWTSRKDDRAIERIEADQDFWTTILPKLRRFYFGSMIPELANPRHPSRQSVREFVDWFSEDSSNSN